MLNSYYLLMSWKATKTNNVCFSCFLWLLLENMCWTNQVKISQISPTVNRRHWCGNEFYRTFLNITYSEDCNIKTLKMMLLVQMIFPFPRGSPRILRWSMLSFQVGLRSEPWGPMILGGAAGVSCHLVTLTFHVVYTVGSCGNQRVTDRLTETEGGKPLSSGKRLLATWKGRLMHSNRKKHQKKTPLFFWFGTHTHTHPEILTKMPKRAPCLKQGDIFCSNLSLFWCLCENFRVMLFGTNNQSESVRPSNPASIPIPFHLVHLSHEKMGAGCSWVYRGWKITQLYRHYNKPF